jgi:hypothetical protein
MEKGMCRGSPGWPCQPQCVGASRRVFQSRARQMGPGRGFVESMMIPLKRHLRRWLDARGPRIRKAVYAAVINSGRPIDTAILRDLAAELEQEGDLEAAVQCWTLVHKLTPCGSDSLMDYLVHAVEAGEIARARWLVGQLQHEIGFPPGHIVWLAGLHACHGHYQEAGRVLGGFAASTAEAHRIVSQFPSVMAEVVPSDIQGLANQLRSIDSPASPRSLGTLLDLARLCFTFRKLQLAAKLYGELASDVDLPALDMVAMLYARTRAGQAVPVMSGGLLPELRDAIASQPDALAMLAHVALALGDAKFAVDALERAIRSRHGGAVGLELIVDDCQAMLRCIEALRDRAPELPDGLLVETADPVGEAVPKVFVCGFGWSGSGAVYDEIRGAEGFSEFLGAGAAPLLNADSDTEPTFIQADAGLGDIWIAARASGRISWQRMWDLLCLHVVGLAGIGYNDYKSCTAAANNLHRYGVRYTGPFRRLLECHVRLLDNPVRGGLQHLMEETIESLCAMLLERDGGKAVLFNNAVFGRHAEMLRIFRNYKAVVVFRDPLDVYADRKRQDKNHWRSPRLLADLYGRNLERYIAYRKQEGAADRGLREVPFERFVKDADFRRKVRDWLLDGVLTDTGASRFNPVASSRNIGIHKSVLGPRARKQMHAAVSVYQDMERLAERSWGKMSSSM